MAYFEDNSSYTYLRTGLGQNCINVGWLDSQHEYPKGELEPLLLERLLELCKHPVNKTRGFHICPFCLKGPIPLPGIEKSMMGSAEIRVTDKQGNTYAAPDLIYHYISEHKYLPLPEFRRALRNGSTKLTSCQRNGKTNPDAFS